ncbi:MAG: hypothetical protein A3C16_06010 [Candidatus Sungbacteria bacterium RIFCSPHIGHO2_02_FULL_51_29]|uniref:Glycosyltransferase RgtA/B/C/D-like domain-containing protein n=1 Tax=Candidatus Sungbacteria bacterium RIFCSPHIGHO2_02_FULL_51_29 TaxID=1802273 RepID=A0A1G2KR27_9BACT|nr:MAG: hypothetical protein A3C16_06010 [Candidatus Sungbacteria bacterium RIFCSPHIGHO2_02_FULL_51_29]
MEFFSIYQKRLLWAIVSGAFIISLLHSFYYRIPPTVDAATYDEIAMNVVEGRGFRLDGPEIPLGMDRAVGRVVPGYQLFLAAVYGVFGHHITLIWFIQAVAHALSVLFMFHISRMVFREMWYPAAGLIGAALIAFSPDLIIGSSMLLTETIAIFLMLWFLYGFFRYMERTSLWTVLWSGAVFGVALLVRTPIGVLLLPMVAVFYQKKKLVHALLFVVLSAAVIFPWAWRNWNVYHAFIPSNLTYQDNFSAGNHPKASGELDETRYEFFPSSDYRTYGPVVANERVFKAALRYNAAHPLHFIKLTLYRTSIYFSFARPTGWWIYLQDLPYDRFVVVVLSGLYSVVVLTLGIAGIWQALRDATGETKKRVISVVAMLVLTPLAIVFLIVETRYRYPVYPFFALFAGYYAAYLLRYGTFFERPLLLSFGVLSLNAIFDALRNLDRILERL